MLTDTTLSTVDADRTHRAHAVIEQTFADLIDGPLAHLPSGQFAANAAWLTCAARRPAARWPKVSRRAGRLARRARSARP